MTAPWHALSRTLQEVAWYPPHDPRKASAEYAKTHTQLVVTLDTPCWICGIRHSDVIKLPKEQQAEVQIETHHSELEWASEMAFETDPAMLSAVMADLGGTSPQEFLASVVTDLAARIQGSTAADLREFLDSEGNILVLCAKHHRGSFYGIHSVTYPCWKLQRYQHQGGAQFVRAPAA